MEERMRFHVAAQGRGEHGLVVPPQQSEETVRVPALHCEFSDEVPGQPSAPPADFSSISFGFRGRSG